MSVIIDGSAGITTNSGAVYNGLQYGTATALSSTSVTFTGIPSWVRRITVLYNGISTTGSSLFQVQIGTSGGIQTTGYNAQAFDNSTSNVSTTGFVFISQGNASPTWGGAGRITFCNGTTWVYEGSVSSSSTGYLASAGGYKDLSGTLTQFRITTVNGTDTWDAGTVGYIYE